MQLIYTSLGIRCELLLLSQLPILKRIIVFLTSRAAWYRKKSKHIEEEVCNFSEICSTLWTLSWEHCDFCLHLDVSTFLIKKCVRAYYFHSSDALTDYTYLFFSNKCHKSESNQSLCAESPAINLRYEKANIRSNRLPKWSKRWCLLRFSCNQSWHTLPLISSSLTLLSPAVTSSTGWTLGKTTVGGGGVSFRIPTAVRTPRLPWELPLSTAHPRRRWRWRGRRRWQGERSLLTFLGKMILDRSAKFTALRVPMTWEQSCDLVFNTKISATLLLSLYYCNW